jgi:hypothetical protein
VVGGEAAEEVSQRGALRVVERGEEVLAVGDGDASEFPQEGASWLGQVQRVVAAVAGVAATLQDAVALQLVDQGDQAAGQQAELAGQGLLGPTLVRGHCPEQPGVRRRQPEWREPLGEPLGCQSAELADFEGNPSRPSA